MVVDTRVLVAAVRTPSSGGTSEASSAEFLRVRGFDFLYACKCYLAFPPQAAPNFSASIRFHAVDKAVVV